MWEFLKNISDFITSGIYQFFVDSFAYMITGASLITAEVTLFIIGFSWDIAQQILENLQVSTYLQKFLDEIDSDIVSFMTYVKGFDALLVVLNAKVTKYVMSFFGL